ncbi:L-xylulose reductase [Penicillium cataractarum]|uniref:L-xylulose reductase n=1 Tax=Penicillium cataractarum TaxID=2100454 RepID=A0A9W9VTP2_9EURO|nr:L-xylulose reductase [Penicillium cataractarum]KAJ5389005.1 L-xylulose reductase [Penicillium cataractarum]
MPIPIPSADRLVDLFSLKNKVAVINGASGAQGIGFEAALIITYFNREEQAKENAASLSEEFNVKAAAYHCDVT